MDQFEEIQDLIHIVPLQRLKKIKMKYNYNNKSLMETLKRSHLTLKNKFFLKQPINAHQLEEI